MSSPTKRSENGVPLGRILIILSLFAFPGLIYLGVRHLGDRIKVVDIPIVGEWQAPGKTWRIVFRPDKTLVKFPTIRRKKGLRHPAPTRWIITAPCG